MTSSVGMDLVPLRRHPVAGDREEGHHGGRARRPPDFPDAFAEALRRRGVSLAWLHQRLVERGHPVSPAALSYWRSGRSQPERGTSRDALVEIERLLRVPPGSLTAARPLAPAWSAARREDRARALRRHSGGAGRARRARLRGAATTSWSRCCATSRWTSTPPATPPVLVRVVVQARRDGARRTPADRDPGRGRPRPRFVPTVGCSLGRQRTDLASGSSRPSCSSTGRWRATRPACTSCGWSCRSRRPRRGSTTTPPGDSASCSSGSGSTPRGCRPGRALHADRRRRGGRGGRPRRRDRRARAGARLRTGHPRDPLGLVRSGAGLRRSPWATRFGPCG